MFDILLSLPIVSYFLAPAMTSWSTSLNLLFFYMTWTTLVLSHSPLRIELIGVLALRTVLWLLPSLAFLAFDTLVPSLAESIKFRGAEALPPRDTAVLGRLLGLALVNLAITTALEGVVSLGLTVLGASDFSLWRVKSWFGGNSSSWFGSNQGWFGSSGGWLDGSSGSWLPSASSALGSWANGSGPLFRTSTTLPLPWQIIKHIVLLMAMREALTYYIRRWMLTTNTRTGQAGRIAKLYRASYGQKRRAPPFSLLAYAEHPLPFLVHRLLPVYVPALLVRPHLLVYFLFVGLVTAEETLATSGYSIVPGIMMGGIARRTTVHYIRGDGNYGAWGFLDWIHGTSLGKNVMTDVKDEAAKHHVKERSENAANHGAGMLQDGIDGLKKARRSSRRSKKDVD